VNEYKRDVMDDKPTLGYEDKYDFELERLDLANSN
jgi:hypothetical protein